MVDTLLEIDFGIAPESSRGLTESLSLEDGATQQRRTVNGTLVDLGGEPFRKYEITLQGGDIQPPALDGVWPGQIVTVNCITELCYAVGGSASRDIVPGSQRVRAGFVYYRPRLQMMVDSFEQGRQEWAATVTWSLKLREV